LFPHTSTIVLQNSIQDSCIFIPTCNSIEMIQFTISKCGYECDINTQKLETIDFSQNSINTIHLCKGLSSELAKQYILTSRNKNASNPRSQAYFKVLV